MSQDLISCPKCRGEGHRKGMWLLGQDEVERQRFITCTKCHGVGMIEPVATPVPDINDEIDAAERDFIVTDRERWESQWERD